MTLRPLSRKMPLCKVDGGGDRGRERGSDSSGSRVLHLQRAAWGPNKAVVVRWGQSGHGRDIEGINQKLRVWLGEGRKANPVPDFPDKAASRSECRHLGPASGWLTRHTERGIGGHAWILVCHGHTATREAYRDPTSAF